MESCSAILCLWAGKENYLCQQMSSILYVLMFFTILKQILKEFAATSFAFFMQLHKNMGGVPQWNPLLAFIYCVHFVAIKEEFAFYEPILEPGKNVNVFKMAKSFFARESFHWKTNPGVLCTGGAPAMLGNTSGLAAFLKKGTPHVIMTHCLLHRHTMSWATLPAILKDALSTAMERSTLSEPNT